MDDFESGEFITLSIYDLLTPQKVIFQNHVLTLFLQRHTIHTTPISTFFNFFDFCQRILGGIYHAFTQNAFVFENSPK